jgi:hypothetical protein
MVMSDMAAVRDFFHHLQWCRQKQAGHPLHYPHDAT